MISFLRELLSCFGVVLSAVSSVDVSPPSGSTRREQQGGKEEEGSLPAFLDFESWLRKDAKVFEKNLIGEDGKVRLDNLDVRISKAVGSRGFAYTDKFRHRWRASYDLGTEEATCGADSVLLRREKVLEENTCMTYCDDAGADCVAFSRRKRTLVHVKWECNLWKTCTQSQKDDGVVATFRKFFDNYMYSSLITLPASRTSKSMDVSILGKTQFQMSVPLRGKGMRGIYWSDPCFSSRFIPCKFGQDWDMYNRGIEMLNAVMKPASPEETIDVFGIAGDNFYDQDGRISRALYNGLDLDVKAALTQTVLGNHDAWVCGSPWCRLPQDQSGQGLMQFWAQDTLSSSKKGHDFLDYSVDPDQNWPWQEFSNVPQNLFWYYSVGNVGFIGYAGAAHSADHEEDFKEACAHFDSEKVDFLLLFTHWNSSGLGCPADMTAPAVLERLSQLPGCQKLWEQKRLKYLDGHKHCNNPMPYPKAVKAPDSVKNADDEVGGFMVGAHGMADCTQSGFLFLDTISDGKIRVWYFEERNADKDMYEEILTCVKTRGFIAKCTDLAVLWFEGAEQVDDNGMKTLENSASPSFENKYLIRTSDDEAEEKNMMTDAEQLIFG